MAKVEAGKFNLDAALKGYVLNKMCHSLNSAEKRAAFSADERGYCMQFGLDEEDIKAVEARDKQRLFELGGNMYFLAKLDRVKKTEKK
jgi:protocatechuate 4,5-dioxygenase alpha chain